MASTGKTSAELIADFVHRTGYDDLPEEAVRMARKMILDQLGVVGLISTGGGVQGVQAVNTIEFVVRAPRGWAVPMVMPIAQAWKAFDEKGAPQQSKLNEQLRALWREVARGSRQFRSGTTNEARCCASGDKGCSPD